ncbi:hypothetical protein NDI43_22185 [Microcoleus vaginatus GB2-A3]|uniref:hypothetical protein n=1 Tax=Microcoleus vaginatus TaxID=119532 RepID=UPI0032A6ED8F
MFCKLCKQERREKEEGRRKIEQGIGVNLRSNVVPIYCLTMIVQIPGSSEGTKAFSLVSLLNGNGSAIETRV